MVPLLASFWTEMISCFRTILKPTKKEPAGATIIATPTS